MSGSLLSVFIIIIPPRSPFLSFPCRAVYDENAKENGNRNNTQLFQCPAVGILFISSSSSL